MDGKKTKQFMRRRLRKFEKIMNAVNLANVALIFVFMLGSAFAGLNEMKYFSVFACIVLLFSGFFNLVYWIMWERFNSKG